MKAMARIAASLLAASAAPAPAQPLHTFCLELQRVLDAARYEGGFEQLERARGAPPRLGFAHACRGDSRRWTCHQNLAPEALSVERLAARTAECLPDAEGIDSGVARMIVFTAPHVLIRIQEAGGPRAKVGRIVTFTVERAEP